MLFDRYTENSLKAKTRARRKSSSRLAGAGHDVHDEMRISSMPVTESFSSNKAKASLTEYLAHALLVHFEGSQE